MRDSFHVVVRLLNWSGVIVVVILLTLVTFGCKTNPNHVKPGTSKHWVNKLPAFDLQACFPRTDREFGDEVNLSGMWVAVYDTYPRLNECINQHMFEHGDFEGRIELALRVQPDRSVQLIRKTDLEHPDLKQCIDEALSMVSLPRSSEVAGQEIYDVYELDIDSDDALTVDGSLLGRMIGRIRTTSLDTCSCYEKYKNSVPSNVKFKFRLSPGNPKPTNITLVTEDSDPELVQCLEDHLATIPIANVDQKVTAGYRFKFENSRAMNVERMLGDAAEAENLGNVSEARDLYQRVLASEPNNLKALHSLGQIELNAGKTGRAEELANKILDINDDNASGEYLLARVRYRQERFDEALDLLDDSIDHDDDRPFRAHWLKSMILTQQGDYAGARDAARQARENNPAFATAWIAEARAAHGEGDSEEALALLEHATTLDLVDVSSWDAMVLVYLEMERWEDAVSTANMAADKGFESANITYNKGVALERLGRTSEAGSAFCDAARLNPNESLYQKACQSSPLEEK